MKNALDTYLRINRVKAKDFARSLRITDTKVSRLRRDLKPGIELALQIEEITGGAVPVASWGKRRRKAKTTLNGGT